MTERQDWKDPVHLACRLIRCASVTPLDDGAQAVLAAALGDLGCTCRSLPFGGDHPIKGDPSIKGDPPIKNVFAWRQGTSPGTHFCFAGHTDVVPVGRESDWQSPPFSGAVQDGFVHGRGSVDMKGPVACGVAAFARFLEENRGDFPGMVSFLITGDEEAEAIHGTRRVLEWMKQEDTIPDFCLIGEPTNRTHLGDEMKIGRRGSLTGNLYVDGKAGHSAYPDRACNPIPPLLEMLRLLQSEKWDDGNVAFQPSHSVISSVDVGNPASNVIPAHARALFNIRFNDHWSGKRLQAHLRSLCDSVAYPYRLDMHVSAEPFRVEHADFIKRVGDAVEKIIGRRPKPGTGGGTSDARFIHRFCPVIEYGPIGMRIHQTDEKLPLEEMETLTAIYLEIFRTMLVPSP